MYTPNKKQIEFHRANLANGVNFGVNGVAQLSNKYHKNPYIYNNTDYLCAGHHHLLIFALYCPFYTFKRFQLLSYDRKGLDILF